MQNDQARAVLATGYVRLQNERGEERLTRAFFDTGSEVNLVTEKVVRALRLKRTNFSIQVKGIAGENWCDGGLVLANIKPWFSVENERVNDMIIHFIVIKSIPQPRYFEKERRIEEFDNLVLADPNYNKANPVDILLGVTVWARIIEERILRISDGLIAQSSTFGFIIYGSMLERHVDQKSLVNFTMSSEDKMEAIHQLMQRFWELRDYSAKELSLLEKRAEDQFARSNENGRFIVRIPWYDESRDLGESKSTALNRLRQLERRLALDSDLRKKYNDFMIEYINLGHMRLAREDEIAGGYFIPHHAVIKKFRVVFDASCTTTNGKSLNDIQLAGANLQEHLDVIIMRFRFHRFVLATDVRKMFRQILIHPEDLRYQKILWRFEEREIPKIYVLLTVTYGQKSSPFLAIRTMIELATRYEKEYPLASGATLLERYMDDFFSGTDSIQELKKLYKELCVMMNHGGFELSKWRSNCEELLQFIRQDIAEIDPVMDLSNEYTAVLGLKWESRADSFLFCMETEWSEEVKVTKRVVASEVAKLYDPNGYLAPVIVTAKCFIQKLWQQKMEWDDELSSELREEWKDFFIQLEALNNIRIPRWLLTSGGRAFELIGFADASQKAYGAVIYVRVYDGEKYHCNLLTSRSRVAPVKTISIPRLELCAAETLATLMEQVRRDCHIEYANYHCFTDSMITLNWLRNESAMFKTFVSNRVASVQRSTDVKCWRHVSTKNNPADMLSRGLRAKELPENELWWQGPSFLRQSYQYWPHTEGDLVEEQLVEIQGEFRPKVCARATFKSLDCLQINGLCLIERYSSLNKLVRITACVLSWFRHRATKSEPKSIGYSNELLNEALEYWIRFTQRKVFTGEINLIKEGKALCKSSALFRLNPFLDERSILRLRGRLDNANVSYDEQHPIIIPAHTRFVRLLMQEAHERTQHGHIQIMLHYIRAKYWVIQSRRAALREIKVGDLVIIKEDGLPPNVWCVGRIIEVYPGADNLVRSVKLKTATTELVRPVRKLVRLPIQDQDLEGEE